VAHRVRDRDGATLGDSEEREPIQSGGVYDAFEIAHPCIEREVVCVTVGQPIAAFVIADERMLTRERAQPVAPDRTFPVVLEVRHPVGRLYEWRTRAARSVRDLHSIGRGAEADELFVPPDHRCCDGAAFSNIRDNAKPTAVYRAYHALFHPIVIHRLPRCLDSAVECRRGDVPVTPHGIEQLVFCHNPVAAADQAGEHIEYLRLNMHALATASKLVETRVQLVFAERINQVIRNWCRHLTTRAGDFGNLEPWSILKINIRFRIANQLCTTGR